MKVKATSASVCLSVGLSFCALITSPRIYFILSPVFETFTILIRAFTISVCSAMQRSLQCLAHHTYVELLIRF